MSQTDAEKKAKEQKKLEEQAAKEVAEKQAKEKAEKEAAEKAAAEEEAAKQKAKEEKELAAAQEQKKALLKKPKFWVFKGDLKHNGIFYAKDCVCPETKLEEFKEKGFVKEA